MGSEQTISPVTEDFRKVRVRTGWFPVIIPSRPKSASATSRGGVSAVRTMVLLPCPQVRFAMQ
ncbi:MAG: hypothetical protein OXN21_04295 [Chloroflexota bacterium]|nr:hypothetical protein [Chloroflexota bacterium]